MSEVVAHCQDCPADWHVLDEAAPECFRDGHTWVVCGTTLTFTPRGLP